MLYNEFHPTKKVGRKKETEPAAQKRRFVHCVFLSFIVGKLEKMTMK
jgi:hypothetical protein